MAVVNMREVLGKVKFKGVQSSLFRTLVKANGQKTTAEIADMLRAANPTAKRLKVASIETAVSQLRSNFKKQAGVELPSCWDVKKLPGAGRGRKAVESSAIDLLNDIGDLNLDGIEFTAVETDDETETDSSEAAE